MSSRAGRWALIGVLMFTLALLGPFSVPVPAAAQVEAEGEDEDGESVLLGRFGFGVESTGSACCLSVRFWVEARGSEVVVGAYGGDLFVTLRGMNKVARLDPVESYAGVGLTLRLGAIPPTDPLSMFMALQGFLALEIALTFSPGLTANLEGAVELRPNSGFYTFLGAGVHFNF